ncbi:ubiquinol-cytochrome c reductase iron-sulfur subunit [Methylohalomonas lacus]|uniref:Ubiquinol-cytochrome c reductase iron-sulfur subunit n=1 Tax=Methylohalomonas lacus TaxID=398773 RepID=A0AAE3HKR4_9GAMM|nr:ubiquinol-cytochrome c reductase iron-sulfur subunit [Methylohalomonas lacus]MCS3902233.1 ubiquinol-cytochrome c reductase iron-sulfur subunit [Methylohalomonas lacus]
MCSDEVNRKRRNLIAATTVVGGAGAAATAVPFLSSWQPSARARAIGAPVEVDISDMQPGDLKRTQWQGKPVWVLRRGDETIDELARIEGELRDPDSSVEQQPAYARNEYRSLKPEYLVVVGLCTHLGCSPSYKAPDEDNDFGDDWIGGFFCPCHGSRFDMAGRVYKGVPAPTNMVVPPYKFISDNRILIGEDSSEGVA